MAAIVIAFSVLMEAYTNEFLVATWSAVTGCGKKKSEKKSELAVVQSTFHALTYADVTLETPLKEAGLNSMTTVVLVSEIKKVYKTMRLTPRDVTNCETVGDLVRVMEGRLRESANRPELALGRRTGVVAPNAMKKPSTAASSDPSAATRADPNVPKEEEIRADPSTGRKRHAFYVVGGAD